MKRKYVAAGLVLAVVAAVLCFVLLRSSPPSSAVSVLVDGKAYAPQPSAVEKQEDLRIHVTLDGQEIAVLPFGEPHSVRIVQPGGEENTLRITEESVRMESANCEGQDCVHMEEVTRDNLETRVMFGMIICLPHRLSVEVR